MDMNALKNYANGINEEEKAISRTIVAKVVGVTFEGRQEILSSMTEETPVCLERDRRNTFDPFAVKVMAEVEGELVQVGFLPKAMAKKVSKQLDSGDSFSCEINKLIGGTSISTEEEEVFLNYGLEILVGPKE
jgi:hypothetical protein